MKIYKFKSYAKINLTLNIISKSLHSKMHRIESLVSFIDLADIIKISENRLQKHQVIFDGKFSNNISAENTVSKVLRQLDKKKYLKGKKYLIKITKNIPQKSGMGGGSMNAATILNFFFKQKIINFNQLRNFAKKIGSDVMLGLNNKTKILFSDNSLRELNKKISFYCILIKPGFGCSTKKVFSKNKIFSNKKYFKNKSLSVTKQDIVEGKNDLEHSALKMYPKLYALKSRLLSFKMGKFIRMTGSGSTIVVYFNSKISAENAFKIYKRKLNKNWCILSKII